MLKKLLRAAIANDLRLVARYGCETGYVGYSVRKCEEALLACDEMLLEVQEERNGNFYTIGSALIVPDLDDDEMIADAGGWVNTWLDENEG